MDGGHAGTGLSIAQGLATARDLRHSMERIAVVVGDAALLSGLSLEALNDIGHRQTQLLIVLNDNEMSISPSVGALSKYLSEIKLSQAWQQGKGAWDTATEHVPVVGTRLVEMSRRFRQSVVSFAQPGQLFEDLGITYVGVMPGHDLPLLEETFRRALALNGPVIVHVRTQKGKGYKPAEADQISFHGAALPPMAVPATDSHDRIGAGPAIPANGDAMASSAAGGSSLTPSRDADEGAPPSASVMTDRRAHAAASLAPAKVAESDPQNTRKVPNYTAHFATELVALAADDRRIVGITAGMPTGTGLSKLQAAYPERFIDVGIAEQHAVTLATGLALGGMRPVVALYSTFLQRAFDQTVHDVCQNDAPVLLAVDRAGLVGEDGTSHQGMFTIPAQRMLPNLVIASPRDEQELRSLVRTAFAQDHPFALHYPRDAGFGVPEREPEILPVGRGEVLREGRDRRSVVSRQPIEVRGRSAGADRQLPHRAVAPGIPADRPRDHVLVLDRVVGQLAAHLAALEHRLELLVARPLAGQRRVEERLAQALPAPAAGTRLGPELARLRQAAVRRTTHDRRGPHLAHAGRDLAHGEADGREQRTPLGVLSVAPIDEPLVADLVGRFGDQSPRKAAKTIDVGEQEEPCRVHPVGREPDRSAHVDDV
jgi:hypothetical protein